MKKSLFLLMLLTVATGMAGQPTLLRTEHYTTRSGLASNVVNTAMQDSRGYIWLGTNQGLTRFDGYGFVNFYHEGKDSVKLMENITIIVEDADKGRLLMRGNEGRVLCFDMEGMKFVEAEGMTMPEDPRNRNGEVWEERARKLGVQSKNMTSRRRGVDGIRMEDGREIFILLSAKLLTLG